jgi:hypothetical protein
MAAVQSMDDNASVGFPSSVITPHSSVFSVNAYNREVISVAEQSCHALGIF